MNKVGEFEKVSYEQFHSAMKDEFYEGMTAAIGSFSDEGFADYTKSLYDDLRIPKRATSGSAGYDFKTPFAFALPPGETIKIPTGIRVKIDEGWWLGCLPRSGLGFKYRIGLVNTLGVIDSDYYNSSNEGHIFVKLVNDGDGFMQAIFILYGNTYSDEADGIRDGGMGSTDAKK